MDAAAPAMSVMEVSARQASCVDLVCGDIQAQVKGGAENWLEVDGGDFLCINMKKQVNGALHPDVHRASRTKSLWPFD